MRTLLYACIILIGGPPHLNLAHATFENSYPIDDYLPEFCVAAFIITGNEAEATYWRGAYGLDLAVIRFFTESLRYLVQRDEVERQLILQTVDECKAARREKRSR
jgi:hypothetical protein